MARSNLTRTIAVLTDAIETKAVTDAAGEAMRKSMHDATARYIGADMRMSGFKGGAVEFKLEATSTTATLTLSGGTYALADRGRRRARKRIYAKPRKRRGRRSALSPPGGYRRSVRGARWQGFHITDTHAQDALDAGTAAAWQAIGVAVDKVLG